MVTVKEVGQCPSTEREGVVPAEEGDVGFYILVHLHGIPHQHNCEFIVTCPQTCDEEVDEKFFIPFGGVMQRWHYLF